MNLFTMIMICSVFPTNSITNAMIETGSHANPLAITPYVNDQPVATRTDFKTVDQAAAFAKQQLAAGNRIDIGMMQIPSIWLDKINKRGITLEDLLRSCKNLAVGSDLLNEATAYCSNQVDNPSERQQCALSFYKTSNAKDGLAYATAIEAYAKSHPIASNPINHQIDFDDWQGDPKDVLPTPTFAQADTSTEDASTDPDNDNPDSDSTT